MATGAEVELGGGAGSAVSGRKKKRVSALRRRGVGAVGCSLFATAAAYAQVPPQQPVAPTREEIERSAPSEAPAARPSLTVEGGIERAPCALDRPEYRAIRFTVNQVLFEDLRGLSPEALRPAYAPYLGGEHPVAVICEIRDRAATILRDAGYIASVEVPEQRIADGNVRFQVLMAKLTEIRVRGDAGRAERTIAGYLEKLTRDEVFNRYTAERYLLLAGDLPGYDVRLALRSAGGERGEVVGEVTVLRSAGIVDFNVQNYGSPELGRWGGLLRGQFFGLTGLGDRTSIALFSTAEFSEQQTLQLGHDFRVGSEGLTLSGQFTYAWASPDLGDPAIDIDARTLFATAEASYPFLRTQARTARAALGFDFVDQDVQFNDLALSRDRLRVAFARLDFDSAGMDFTMPGFSPAEPPWRLGASVELRQGLGILGASEGCGPALARCTAPGAIPPSRLEADPSATVIRAEAYGEYRPVPRVTFALGVRSQYSNDALLSFEEFSAGNYTIGRGYDPGTLLGDSGIGFQAEGRWGSVIPANPDAIAAQPYVFLDQAWVWNEDRLFVPAGRQSLTSVGGGVRASLGDRLRLDVAFAVPLDRAGLQTSRPDPRLLVSLTTRLWPWSF